MTKQIADNHAFDEEQRRDVKYHEDQPVPLWNSKGDLMKMLYSKAELRNVDSAVPMDRWEEVDLSVTVMDYNEARAFGKLTNLLELAKQRNIKIYE